MKSLNIIAITVAIIFAAVIFYYADASKSARFSDWYNNDLDFADWMDARRAPKITFEAGVVTLLFFFFYVYVNISNLIKVKSKTTRILSIIGLAANGIMIAWCLLMLSSPTHISFDEASGGWIVFAGLMLAFSIVYLVQCLRDPKEFWQNDEILDDVV